MPKGQNYGAHYVYPKGMSSADKKLYHAKATYEAKKIVRTQFPYEYEHNYVKLGNATRALNAMAKNHPDIMHVERLVILDKLVKDYDSDSYVVGEEVEVSSEDVKEALEAVDNQERVRVTSEDLGLERGQTYTQIETPERAPLVKEAPRKGFFARLLSVVGL